MRLTDPPIREYVHNDKTRITRPWVLWFQEMRDENNTVRDRLAQVFPASNENNTVWDDVRVSLELAKQGGGTVPTFTSFRGGTYAYRFAGNAVNEVYFSLQLPHRYKAGSTLRPHIHWASAGTSTNVVEWNIDYVAADINNVFAATATTLQALDAASGTAYQHQLASFGDMDGTDLAESSMILFRLYRDGVNDANNDNVFGLEFDIHFQQDKLGTENEYPD